LGEESKVWEEAIGGGSVTIQKTSFGLADVRGFLNTKVDIREILQGAVDSERPQIFVDDIIWLLKIQSAAGYIIPASILSQLLSNKE
jgi:hypothetical protein